MDTEQDFSKYIEEESTYGSPIEPVEPAPEPVYQEPMPQVTPAPKMVSFFDMLCFGFGTMLIGIAIGWYINEYEYVLKEI